MEKNNNTVNKKTIKKSTIEPQEIIVEKEPILETPISEIVKELPKLKIYELYKQIIIDGNSFKVYLRDVIIYDTKNKEKYPIFEEEYFIVGGKKYIYKGTRIEIY